MLRLIPNERRIAAAEGVATSVHSGKALSLNIAALDESGSRGGIFCLWRPICRLDREAMSENGMN